jgi:hypothetical protein
MILTVLQKTSKNLPIIPSYLVVIVCNYLVHCLRVLCHGTLRECPRPTSSWLQQRSFLLAPLTAHAPVKSSLHHLVMRSFCFPYLQILVFWPDDGAMYSEVFCYDMAPLWITLMVCYNRMDRYTGCLLQQRNKIYTIVPQPMLDLDVTYQVCPCLHISRFWQISS